MKKALKISLIIILSLVLVLSIFSIFYINSIMKEVRLTPFDKNKLLASTTSFLVYDNAGNSLTNNGSTGHEVIKIDDLNDYTIDAFVSIEDKDFYKHKGLNYRRIAKAMLNNIKSMSFKEGASTISQQLIKNTHLTNDKTIRRKIKEMMLTKKLEKTFSKNDIMEMYLNVIYFGDGCYGINEASKHYFGKSASLLTPIESATLAGIIKSPYTYSPIYNYENCLKRRNLVLSEMQKDGKLNNIEDLKNQEIELSITDNPSNRFDIYTQSAINEACDLLRLSEKELALNGYIINTFYDKQIQSNIVESMEKLELPKNTFGNTCERLAIIINNSTGGIEAMYTDSKYNLLDMRRQPGSAIKPVMVYSPALEEGLIYNCSTILDEKIDYDGYSPNNVGNVFHGYVNIYDCIGQSLNTPAVKLMDYLGVKKCKKWAEKVGIKFDENDNGLSLALGGFTYGTTLKELTSAYLPYSNNGNMISTGFVSEIKTKDGITLYKKNREEKSVMSADTAYLTSDLLRYGVTNGTSINLKKLPFEVYGKTGTVAVKGTNQNTDAISIAYTSEHTMGTWYGNYSYEKEYNLEGNNNGGTNATKLICATFEKLYKNNQPSPIERPNTIVEWDIDTLCLKDNHIVKLADVNTPPRYRKKEIFSSNQIPIEISTTFSDIEVKGFKVTNNDSKNVVEFETKDYIIYDIICNDKLLQTIENQSGNTKFEHTNLKPNTAYNYEIEAYTIYNNVVKDSDTITIITPDFYQNYISENTPKIIDNNEENPVLPWYFY